VAENDEGEWSAEREVEERGTELNRPLTARPNLSFHRLYNVYMPNPRTLLSAGLLFQSSLLYFTHYALFKPAQPLQCTCITQPNAFCNPIHIVDMTRFREMCKLNDN